jgi:hypothetical protein
LNHLDISEKKEEKVNPVNKKLESIKTEERKKVSVKKKKNH